MSTHRFPTEEGAKEVAESLGVSVNDMLKCQDWEYTFPSLSDLPRYERLYSEDGTSDLAKRVLGCFIFQCLEDSLSAGSPEETVRTSLVRLVSDFHIHEDEFRYWAHEDDKHYNDFPEEGWHIMKLAREYKNVAEQGASSDR
ncbi:hypothetical protein NT6N_04160 [Oceaniferula spumae]|uniref:Uncharacterized protein n=1 Tax=Oceaniferula spumae TaxID=2979115 RepID=A0AAT9FHB8_9BACT